MKKVFSKDFALCLLSAVLLIFAFPKTDWWLLSWVGLIPFFHILEGKSYKEAFWRGYFWGWVFFFGLLCWVFHISHWFGIVLGALAVVALVSYLALYAGFFAIGYVYLGRKKNFALFLIPSWWATLEYIRSHLFSGFDWGALGYSQYKNIIVLQFADLVGVTGLSFLIVLVNYSLKEMFFPSQNVHLRGKIVFVFCVMFMVLYYGVINSAFDIKSDVHTLKVSVIQANISQDRKWNETDGPQILEEHIELTKQALNDKPDLIVWPETSLPGFVNVDFQYFRRLKDFTRQIKTPVLVGSIEQEGEVYYNSAFLLDQEGNLTQTYRKIHLVPFGEFLPLRNFFPFLADLIGVSDFTAGQDLAVFQYPSAQEKFPKRFSVLICFEDATAGLVSRFVQEGAQAFINVTNDGWFLDSKAPWMHLQASVLRAVENRRSVVRAANTGVSGFIDPFGRIKKLVFQQNRHTLVKGHETMDVLFTGKKSFYTMWGDFFTFLCVGCILMGVLKKEH